jgi:hypothetical protein
MPQLEAMERAKYEESKATAEQQARHTSVVNSTTSVLRSTHQEQGKSQLSPGMYQDADARRTPVNYSTSSMSRGSPMLGRGQEGMSCLTFSLKVFMFQFIDLLSGVFARGHFIVQQSLHKQ